MMTDCTGKRRLVSLLAGSDDAADALLADLVIERMDEPFDDDDDEFCIDDDLSDFAAPEMLFDD